MARPAPKTAVAEMDRRFGALATAAKTEPVAIVWWGDSIPEGYGSSTPMKNWPHETQRALQVYFGHTILNTDGTFKSGMKPLSFKTVSSRYAFPAKPNWFDVSLDSEGTFTNQSSYGGGRKGTIQAINSKRSWTDTMTSAVVRGNFANSDDRLVIRVDGNVVKTVAAGSHQAGTFAISTGVFPSAQHTVEVEFLTGKTVCEEWFILDGSEAKGFWNIEWCKSQTSTYEFIVSSGYGGQYPGKHLDGLATLPAKKYGVIEWMTNDSSAGSGKRTVAQYGADSREFIRMVRAIAPDMDLLFLSPQPRKPVSQPMVAPWADYIEEQHVIASEFPFVKVGNLGIPMSTDPSKDPYMSDGLHLSDLGAAMYAGKTVGVMVGGATTTPTPGAPVAVGGFTINGDSLAEEYTVRNAALKAAYPAMTITSRAKGGWLSAEAAAYQGGEPALVTLPNGIPAGTTAVTVTVTPNLLAIPNPTTGTWSTTGSISGIPGTLSMTRTNGTDAFTFARTTAGTALAAPAAPVEFVTGAEFRNTAMVATSLGRNDAFITTPAVMSARWSKMKAYSTVDPKVHILWEIPAAAKATEAAGTANRAKIDAINARMKADHPDNYLEVATYLRSAERLRAAGITPTATDLQNIADGFIPESFRITLGDGSKDTLHYNQAAYDQITPLLIDHLTASGIAPTAAPADDAKPIVAITSRYEGGTSAVLGGTVTGKFQLEATSTTATGTQSAKAMTGAATDLGPLRPKDPSKPNGTDWIIDLDAAELAAKGYEGIRVISTGVNGKGGSSPTMRLTFKAPATTTPPPPPIPDPIDPKAPQGLLVESDLKALVQVREGFNSLHKYGFSGVAGADETVAVQRAIIDTMQVAGGRLTLPAGEIGVSNLVADYATMAAQAASGSPFGYAGLTVQGQGRRKTVLRQIAGSTGDLLTIKGRTGTQAGPGNNNKVSGAKIQDLELRGTATGGHGLYLQSIIDSEFEQLHINQVGGSGVFMARAAFSSGNYDEYFLGMRFIGVKSTANGKSGFESDGQAAVSFHAEDCEAVGNAIDGWRIAGSNVRLTKCDAYGNGVGKASSRGFRFLRNALTGSSVDGVSMAGGRAEQNGAAGGYEIEVEAGGGYLFSGVTILATGGAHGIGVGLKGYGASTVRSFRLEGATVRGDNATAAQRAVVIGSDSLGARVDNRLDFDSFASSNGTVASVVTDNGVASSFPLASAHRTTAAGNFEILAAGGGVILPAPGGTRFRVTVNDAGQLVTTAV